MATPSGEKPIASLKVGDQVIAYNPNTGQAEAEPIQHVWINHDHDLVDVRVSETAPSAPATTLAQAGALLTTAARTLAAAGVLAGTLLAGHHALAASSPSTASSAQAAPVHAETIHTTANHPWLTADRGWVVAGDLHAGEGIVTLDGAAATVAWVHTVPGQADRYNLTVAQDHTYAVGASQVVVHNRNCQSDIPQGLSAEQFQELSNQVWTRVGGISTDIQIQGSRAAFTAGPESDIDIAIRVDQETFDQLIRDGFGTPNPGSARERTMLHALEIGKIQSGELRIGGTYLKGFRRSLTRYLGMEVDLSAILIGGPFDEGPMIPLWPAS